MGGGKGGGDTTTTIRFAPYIEDHHKAFLDILAARRDIAIDDSPYDSFVAWDIDDGFFGIGYVMSSFPSLYDMYGKFLAGLDVDGLFNQIFEDTVNGTVLDNLVSAEADTLSDDIEQVADPRFVTGMRDINSVVSSTFVVGRAMMETARTKAVSKFSADIRYRMVPVATERWKTHLEWNRDVIKMYAEILKLYIAGKMDVDNHSLEIAAKNTLWPFTVLKYFGEGLGALTGAKNITEDVAGASKTAKAIGGALTGAAAGWTVSGGNPVGAAIGGVLGLAGGLLS